MSKNDEKYAGDKFNTRSLLDAYRSITKKNVSEFSAETDAEFGGELGQEAEKEKYVSGGLMSTYAQMMDTYQEGTIDGQISPKDRRETKLPSESLNDKLK
jgi:hypothetical protein